MRPEKFDDRQIESGALADLGKEIAARLQKVRAYETAASEKAGVELQKAQDHRDAIAKLLVEAKAKCRGLGFKTFKEKYCPDFGRSKIYQLLQIGRGDTTADEIRETKRVQKRKERAVRDTGNVADNSAAVATEPEPTPAVSTPRGSPAPRSARRKMPPDDPVEAAIGAEVTSFDSGNMDSNSWNMDSTDEQIRRVPGTARRCRTAVSARVPSQEITARSSSTLAVPLTPPRVFSPIPAASSAARKPKPTA